MPNHLLIYVIVALNVACQFMLIWRLKLERRDKVKYCLLAAVVPLIISATMRLMVGTGIIHVHLAEQNAIERTATSLASIFLIAGPFLVTVAAVLFRRKQIRARILQHQ